MRWLSEDRGRGRVRGFLQDGTSLLWKWIGEGIVLLVGGFGHMARNCRNRGMRGRVGDNRRVEYGGGRIEEISNFENNLKEGENLELLN